MRYDRVVHHGVKQCRATGAPSLGVSTTDISSMMYRPPSKPPHDSISTLLRSQSSPPAARSSKGTVMWAQPWSLMGWPLVV